MVRQTLPLQQPVGHDWASQIQAPPTQRLPAKQALPVMPQEHTPLRH